MYTTRNVLHNRGSQDPLRESIKSLPIDLGRPATRPFRDSSNNKKIFLSLRILFTKYNLFN